MYPPSKSRRYRIIKRTTTINPINPVPDLSDFGSILGAETVLAACIIRQAVDDLKETRAGKRFNREHPWASDPLGDLRAFFTSDWFAALAHGLGQEPRALLKRMQAVDL